MNLALNYVHLEELQSINSILLEAWTVHSETRSHSLLALFLASTVVCQLHRKISGFLAAKRSTMLTS